MTDSEFGGQGVSDIEAHYRTWLTGQREMRAVRDAFAEGLSLDEVAAVTGLDIATVKQRIESFRRWPAAVDFGPYELMVQARVEAWDRPQLIEKLAAWDFATGVVFLPSPLQGTLDGSWEIVARNGRMQGLVSVAEAEAVTLLRNKGRGTGNEG